MKLTFIVSAHIFVAARRSEGRSDLLASRPRGLLLADFPLETNRASPITLATARRCCCLFIRQALRDMWPIENQCWAAPHCDEES